MQGEIRHHENFQNYNRRSLDLVDCKKATFAYTCKPMLTVDGYTRNKKALESGQVIEIFRVSSVAGRFFNFGMTVALAELLRLSDIRVRPDSGTPWRDSVMNFDGIRLFILAAKHLNITRAASEFHLNQSAASRKLKQLEIDVRNKLYARCGGGIQLTVSGRELLARVVPIMSDLDDLAKSIANGSRPRLAVTACRGPSAILLPRLMAKFRENNPATQLSLYPANSSEAKQWLETAEVDLAIITSPPRSPLFVVESYRSERLMAFIASTHPLARMSSNSLSRSDLPLIVRANRPDHTRTENELQKLSRKRQKLTIVMRCGSAQGVKEAVRAGAGVGILYEDTVKHEIGQNEFKRVKIVGLNLERKSYIVYLRDKPIHGAMQKFLSLLRRSAAETSPIKTTYPQSSNGHRNVRHITTSSDPNSGPVLNR